MIEFRFGLEVCAANPPEVLRGARFGLVMNQASIDSGFRTADEVLGESLPGQLAMRLAFGMQSMTANRDWGVGYLLMARKPEPDNKDT